MEIRLRTLARRLLGVYRGCVDLDLSGCTLISDESLLDLAKLSELRSLRLAATSISDAGLQQLAPLRNLETLSIRYCNVKGVGLVSLAKLPNLKHLDLSGDEITDRGLESLKSLRGLRTLGLENTKVTAAGVRSLRQALPDCKITADDPGHAAKKTGISESAGQNRHGVADERAAWKRISEPIPTLSHAPDDGVTVAGLMPGSCPECGCAPARRRCLRTDPVAERPHRFPPTPKWRISNFPASGAPPGRTTAASAAERPFGETV